MNFEFLFRAIELFDQNRPSLKSILFDARRRLRFAEPPPAMADEAERRGVKLLDTPNFREVSSGWLNPGPIVFPVIRHPTTHETILKRLKWMLDSRLADDAGDFLWEAVIEALPRREQAGRTGLYRCSLADLAASLEKLHQSKRHLFNLLMSGRLGEARKWLCGKHPGRDAMRVTRMMSIVWMLFDLQIVSYRLLRGEFVALDQPLTDARSMNLASMEKLLKRLQKLATRCKEAFEAGQTNLPRSVTIFLNKWKLREIAADQLKKLTSIKPDEEAVLAEVRRMLDRSAKWSRRLTRLWTHRAHAFSLSFNKLNKSTFEIDLAQAPKAFAHDAHQSSTAIKFGAPSVTLLLFAVTEAVEDLGRHPAHVKSNGGDQLKPGDHPPLMTAKTRQRLTCQLFTVLRDLYARPASAMRASVLQTAAANRNHALKAVQHGKVPSSLEPLPPDPLNYPLVPFLFGTAAHIMLSPGPLEEPGLKRSPENWLANRIDVASMGKSKAVSDKRSANPWARRVASRIRRDFTSQRP